MIEVRHLTKFFGATVAVDRISFEVGKGQVVGFLGPNGAGKSTTLRMLACYLSPTAGDISIGGFDTFAQSEQVRQILGYLPENCPLYPEMRVEDYLGFRASLRRLDRATRRRRIEYVVDRCWLSKVRRRPIGHLSKGYRQRVGLADALLHEPAVLILDELTIGLDPVQIIETRKLIKELGGQHTVLLSTHILPEVQAVCERAIIIVGGRIAAQGTPQELRESLQTSSRVVVECRGPAPAVRAALIAVSGVTDVEIAGSSLDPTQLTAAVTMRQGNDLREQIGRVIAGNGWPLRELRRENATLEELFVHVTSAPPARDPGEGGSDSAGVSNIRGRAAGGNAVAGDATAAAGNASAASSPLNAGTSEKRRAKKQRGRAATNAEEMA